MDKNVAKVGVRTRDEAVDMAVESSGQTKRRKVGDGQLLDFSSSSLTHELNSFCRFPDASVSQGAANESQYSNFSSASCCSSNRSAEASTDQLNSTNLEKESVEIRESSSTKYDSSESRETTPLNQQAVETLQPESTSETSCRRQITVENLMPLEAELEEFFAVAEKNLRKQFAEKYNYDISKDEPLGGRYEWVPLKS